VLKYPADLIRHSRVTDAILDTVPVLASDYTDADRALILKNHSGI